jgi:hypothetical protein
VAGLGKQAKVLSERQIKAAISAARSSLLRGTVRPPRLPLLASNLLIWKCTNESIPYSLEVGVMGRGLR